MEAKMVSKQWKFPGSPDQFVGVVMWAITLRQVFKEDHPEKYEVANQPDICMKVAGDYGITYENVAREMVQLRTRVVDNLEHMRKLERDLEASFNPATMKRTFDDIKDVIPDYFYAAMAGELFSIYGWERSKELFYPEEESGDLLSGSEGWYRAFVAACKKVDLEWLAEYRDSLEWYDADRFDGMIEAEIYKGFMKKDKASIMASNYYYRYLVGRNDSHNKETTTETTDGGQNGK